MLTEEQVDSLRKLFPVTHRLAYLNHASVAPTPTTVREAVGRWIDDVCHFGVLHESTWEERAETVRARCARLMGAHPEEVAFVRNTSHGLSLVAEGLDWEPGDRVLVATAVEYPSNVYPWQHLAARGVELVPIPTAGEGVRPAEVAAVMDHRTRLVAVSSAQYATGAVTDLAAIGALCREGGALLCVDGIQTLGALPLDVKEAGIHFLSADSHKWLLGISGIGCLFVDRQVVDRLRPVLTGWKSMVGAWDFDRLRFELIPDARKLEEGSPAYGMISGLGAVVELLLSLGIDAIYQRIRSLVERLAAQLEAIGCAIGPEPAWRHHILTFVPRVGDPAELQELLRAGGIVVSQRRGRIRVSPHCYNTEAELDRLVAAVDEFQRGR